MHAGLRAIWMGLDGDAEGLSTKELRRRRAIVLTLLVQLPLVVLIGAVAAVAGESGSLVWPSLAFAAGVVALVLQLRRVAADVVGNLVVAGAWLAATGALLEEGFGSSTWVFVLIVPVLAGLLLGRSGGLIWSFVGALTLSAVIVGHGVGRFGTPDAGAHLLAWLQSEVVLALLVAVTQASLVAREAAEALENEVQDRLHDEVLVRRAAETAARRAEQAARQAVLQQHQFSTRLHDHVRAHMVSALGAASLLNDADEQTRPALLETIAVHGEDLLCLLEDVADLARLDADRLSLAEMPLNLVRQLPRWVGAAVGAGGDQHRVSVEIDPGFPRWIVGDSRRIEQVLGGLLWRAALVSGPGELRVGLDVDETWYRLTVEDRGPPLDKTSQGTLFEPFHFPTVAFGARGSALRLSLVHRLVRAMRGRVLYHRTEIGSRIEVRLPLHLTSAPSDACEVTPSREERYLRLVLCDDHPVNHLVVERVLVGDGHEVLVAASADEVLGLVASGRIDAVLLDLDGPDGVAEQTIQRIRGYAGDAGLVPVLGLAVSVDDERYLTLLEVGIDEVLPKPVRPDVLRGAVLRWTSDLSDAAA